MKRRDFHRSTLAALAITAFGCTPAPRRPISEPTAIDTHAHVFHRGLAFLPQRRFTPSYDAYAEEYLAVIDANAVTGGVVIQFALLGTDNSYLLEALRLGEGRLRGVVMLDPQSDLDKIGPLDASGVRGIRLPLAASKSPPDLRSSPWRELVQACIDQSWHVEIYDKAERLQQSVNPLLEMGADVVVDHFGRPDPARGIEDPGFRYLLSIADSRQVWVKLSAPYRTSLDFAAAAAPTLLESFGPNRLLWGSDWPFIGFEDSTRYEAMRALLNSWVPDDAQRQTILTETPAALYRF